LEVTEKRKRLGRDSSFRCRCRPDWGYVIASRANGETNARGCFVAGDTLTANNLKTVAVALSTGMWKKSKDIFFSWEKGKAKIVIY
jgi:hypothetical protein